MNIYRHELRAYRWHTIIWSASLCGLMILMMCFFPIFQKDVDAYTEMMANFPEAIKAALGIVIDNFATPLGYYAFCFTYTSLIAAIQAMNLGVGILSKEERERTADFLMTKPVSRVKIVTSKLLAVLTVLVITNVLYNIASIVMILSVAGTEVDIHILMLMNLSVVLLQLIFCSIGLAISVFMKKVRSVPPVSLGFVFAFFAISAFAVTSKEDKLRFLTPFQYFTTNQIMEDAGYELTFVILGAVIVLAGLALTYYRFIRKNIPSL